MPTSTPLPVDIDGLNDSSRLKIALYWLGGNGTDFAEFFETVGFSGHVLIAMVYEAASKNSQLKQHYQLRDARYEGHKAGLQAMREALR